MANMRYRKPSVKTILGVTRLKKRAKKALGINKLLWPFRAVNNYKRRMLRQAGYYSPEMKALRAAQQGKVPGPIGAIHLGDGERAAGDKGDNTSALLMAAMLAKGEHEKKGDADNPLLMAAMLAQGTQGKGTGKGRKKGSKGPNLAEAMLLATALKGSEADHAPRAKHAAAEQPQRARHAEEQDEPRAAQPRAGHAREKSSAEAEQPAPKRHRGWRLFGLFLAALLVAVAIITIWYYWIA